MGYMQPVYTNSARHRAAARNSPGIRSCLALLALSPATVVGTAEAKVNAFGVSWPKWGAARSALARWGQLQASGAGYAEAPKGTTLAAARAFVRHAEAAGISSAEPYSDEDGEIGFRWRTAKGLASVSFMSDGNLVAYVFDQSSGRPPLEIDEPFNELAHCGELLKRIREAV